MFPDEICLASFPFGDSPGMKLRPVLRPPGAGRVAREWPHPGNADPACLLYKQGGHVSEREGELLEESDRLE
jgi:hypothetical protein